MALKVRFALIFFISLLLNFQYSFAQIEGCTDARANNYNSSATINDGSCTYDKTTINPRVVISELPAALLENSGMFSVNGLLWFHNDSGGEAELYGLDTIKNEIIARLRLINASNIDWEELGQDKEFVYVGDIGNNNGTRTDLKIYRIDKSLFPDTGTINISANIIEYSYPDQVLFTPRNNNHNFDCEAFIVSADSIYLFSKNWVNEWTKIYKISKKPGTYVAELMDSFDVRGLITSADFNEEDKILCLLGYQNYVPFFWLMFDFNAVDFLSGNKRRFDFAFKQIGNQTEAVIFHPNKGVYISSEKSSLVTNQLMEVYTWPWTKPLNTGFFESDSSELMVYPNPNRGSFRVILPKNTSSIINIQFVDSSGRIVIEMKKEKRPETEEIEIHTENIADGHYFLIIMTASKIYRKSIHLVN